jgi:hypothetical protein
LAGDRLRAVRWRGDVLGDDLLAVDGVSMSDKARIEAQLALLKIINESAQSMGRSRIVEFIGRFGEIDVDEFINSLVKNNLAEVMPRSVQGINEQVYELRIKHKGKLFVQKDQFKDLPARARIAEKYREIGKSYADLADLFTEE